MKNLTNTRVISLRIDEAEEMLRNKLDSHSLKLVRDGTDMTFYNARNNDGSVNLDGGQVDERLAECLGMHRVTHFCDEAGGIVILENFKVPEENAGYEIILSETYAHELGDAMRVVLGRKVLDSGEVKYVTWESRYDPSKDEYRYDFGHYDFKTYRDARADYHKRLADKWAAYGEEDA